MKGPLGILCSLMAAYFVSLTRLLPNEKLSLDLEQDGFLLFHNVSDKESILQYLPPHYVFLDYSYTIIGSVLSTFHRDVTSSQYVYQTKFPVYTYIEYNITQLSLPTPMLAICPQSHHTVPFLWSNPVVIQSQRGDSSLSLLFNCDCVHAGLRGQDVDSRLAVQFKVVHTLDVDRLKHLHGLHTVKYSTDSRRLNSLYEWILVKASLLFAFPANHVFTSHLQARQDSWFASSLRWVYSDNFYNQQKHTETHAILDAMR